jgi:hypothetical protein
MGRRSPLSSGRTSCSLGETRSLRLTKHLHRILGFFVSFAILWIKSQDKVVIGLASFCLGSFAIFLGWAVSASYQWSTEPYAWLFTIIVEALSMPGRALAKMVTWWMPSSIGKRGRSQEDDIEMQSQTSEGVSGSVSSPTGRVSSGLRERAQSNVA